MNVHACSIVFSLSAVSKKRAIRELTPSNPKPTLGHPKPVETTGGVAKGNEAAEKYVMDKSGRVATAGGGRRSSTETCAFSGMDRKEGMRYLQNNRVTDLARHMATRE
jgi:hypothetical protein